jgi:hypothetical protein
MPLGAFDGDALRRVDKDQLSRFYAASVQAMEPIFLAADAQQVMLDPESPGIRAMSVHGRIIMMHSQSGFLQ